MRRLVFVALLALGCSGADLGDNETDVAVEVADEVGFCLNVATALDSELPQLRAATYDAAGGWGRSVVLDAPGCANWLAIAEPEQMLDARRQMETLHLSDGSLRINVNLEAIATGRLVDSEESCGTTVLADGTEVWQTPALRPLLHELGHAFGFRAPGGPDDGRHSANQESLMAQVVRSGCHVVWPTSIERSSLVSAAD